MQENQKFENWLPLESNSDLLNKYLFNLGVNTEIVNFVDVLSFEKEFLTPGALGVLFVYPDSKLINNYFFNLGDKLFERPVANDLYYMKQEAENACGTVAILHIMANILNEYPFILNEESFISTFVQNTLHLNPEQRGTFLKDCKIEIKKENGQNQSLQQAHQEIAEEGVEPDIELKPGHHFVSYIWKNGCVYELDGRKKAPINFAECSQEDFLEKVTEICKENYIQQDEKCISFSMMALQIGF